MLQLANIILYSHIKLVIVIAEQNGYFGIFWLISRCCFKCHSFFKKTVWIYKMRVNTWYISNAINYNCIGSHGVEL